MRHRKHVHSEEWRRKVDHVRSRGEHLLLAMALWSGSENNRQNLRSWSTFCEERKNFGIVCIEIGNRFVSGKLFVGVVASWMPTQLVLLLRLLLLSTSSQNQDETRLLHRKCFPEVTHLSEQFKSLTTTSLWRKVSHAGVKWLALYLKLLTKTSRFDSDCADRAARHDATSTWRSTWVKVRICWYFERKCFILSN